MKRRVGMRRASIRDVLRAWRTTQTYRLGLHDRWTAVALFDATSGDQGRCDPALAARTPSFGHVREWHEWRRRSA